MRDAALEPSAFFLFKAAYEKDSRYADERVEKYDDFNEYLPINNDL